jgi:alkylhydroperoxidase family enzyme
VQSSQFVFSQHCKAARRSGIPESQIQAIPSWPLSAHYSPLERAVLAYTDCLVLQGGRVPDDLFDEVKCHLRDEDILELTYHVLSYNLHAVSCKALRLEFDDVPERIREVPAPQ